MTEKSASLPASAVEAMLIAHRRLIRLLLAEAAARDPGLIERASAQFGYRDAHEDPGSEPDLAFAIEIAAQRELDDLLRGALPERSADSEGQRDEGKGRAGAAADRAAPEPGADGARSAREGDL